MFDVTVTTVTNLHLSPADLLAVLAVPFGTWRAWKSRYDLARIAAVLRRRFPLDGHQKATERLPAPSKPLALPEPQKASRRLP